MSRKIVLYRNCRILEDKNMQVDNLKDYLATLQTKVFPNVTQTAEPQIIKNINDIDLTIKVDVDQEDYLKRSVHNQYNYAMITIDDNIANTNAYYYFIRKINWKSQKCAELELHMDVLNTYQGEYTLTDKTTIQRMHKDRFASKVNRSWNQIGYLDEQTVWDWEITEAEAIGNATFTLPDAFKGEDFTKDLVTFEYDQEPYSRNLWEFSRDVINNTIHITMYIQQQQIPQEPYGVFVSYNSLLRDVDYVDEGIQPVLYKVSEDIVHDGTKMKWYLMYKNATPVAPATETEAVDTWLIPENSIKVTYRTSPVTNALNANDHISSSSHAYYVFGGEYGYDEHVYDDQNNIPVYVSDDGTNWEKISLIYTDKSTVTSLTYRNYIMMEHSDDKINIKECYWEKWGTSTYAGVKNLGAFKYVKLGGYKSIKYKKSTTFLTSQNIAWKQGKVIQSPDYQWNFTGGATATAQTTGIDLVDKTDGKIIKIIELPYAPATVTYDNVTHTYSINNLEESIWVYNTSEKMFKQAIRGVNIRLEQNIKNTTNPINKLKLLTASISTAQNRDDTNESKLYHSAYYINKYVYDSFNYGLALENYDISKFTTDWNIHYLVANTCSSRFMFDFTNFYNRLSTQDYDNMFTVARNNEITIANSSYIQYLRNGYNYDQKTRAINTVQAVVNVGSTAAKGAVGGALTGSSGGAVGAAFGAALGAAGGIFNTIVSVTEAERSQIQKMNELKNQAGSVNGADDIDLLRYYTHDNKMKLCLYEVSDNTKERIADLFYYCGYNVGLQAVPNTTSRYWFNFIQCTPVYDTDSTKAKLNKECLDELTRKYQSGVTVYHKHTTWDFDQIKENWEVALLN